MRQATNPWNLSKSEIVILDSILADYSNSNVDQAIELRIKDTWRNEIYPNLKDELKFVQDNPNQEL